MKKIILSLLIAISVFSVGCLDAFALTKNELKIVGMDIDTLVFTDMLIDGNNEFTEGQVPTTEMVNEYVLSKISWNEKYITNLDKQEEGEFPIYKVPASVFEGIITNSFNVDNQYLVNYRANFDITYNGFGEWYDSKYYEENGVYYYTYQTPAGMGFAIETQNMIKGYKDLGNGTYMVLAYAVDMEPTENFSTTGLVLDRDYVMKNGKAHKIHGYALTNIKLSNGYTKFMSYAVKETNEVNFDGLTIVDKPTYDPKLEFLNGEKQDFNIEGKDLLTFRIDADVNLLEDVYIDTEIVDPKNYTVKSGSTIITFTKEFTKKLKTGEHTLLASYSDGTYAETTFKLTIGNPETFGNGYEVIVLLGLFLGITIIMSKRGKKVSLR